MKLIKTLMIAAVVLTGIATQAQTVDEIISKHVEALGGKDVLGQIKSLYLENTMEAMGNSVPQKEYLLVGKGYKREVEFNGSNIINCVTDNGGWSVNPMMGGTNAEPLPEGLYKSEKVQIYTGGALIDYAVKGYKAELAGNEEESFKIKVSGDGLEIYYYIDQKTYLLNKTVSKSEMMGQEVDVTIRFSDYRKTDLGYMLAYAKNIDMGMFQFSLTVSKVEMNKEIDPAIFEMPK